MCYIAAKRDHCSLLQRTIFVVEGNSVEAKSLWIMILLKVMIVKLTKDTIFLS